jgi:host factor-I protein
VSKKEQQNIQGDFLASLIAGGAPVSIFLVNGIRLVGQIVAFDQYVIQLRNNGGTQLVYKHAISSVLPQATTEITAARPKVTLLRPKATRSMG